MAADTAGDRFVRVDDGDMHVVLDGAVDAPVVLLIHGLAGSTASWDQVVPALASTHRVIRVDLFGHGKSTSPADGYDIPTQARRVGAALDELGVGRVTVIGHSTGGSVATALAEQRPDVVGALALVNTGPSLDARITQSLLNRLMMTGLGRLLWPLRTPDLARKAFRAAITRPIDIPEAVVADLLGMTHRALAATSRASLDYLGQRSLPARLAPLGLTVLVIFGAEDKRWRSASAATYRVIPDVRIELLPGVGHTPMLEDPQTTGTLLREFAATAGHAR
ncbi:alpha/beta fold hydrolase [Nocardia sp. CA-128927]|uniref:alpha/beta fold hydrolase n=1 Tax=Nocardia sp. CA-128927 TaxID=3239975 RepID=UPI003D998E78